MTVESIRLPQSNVVANVSYRGNSMLLGVIHSRESSRSPQLQL